jgi:diguanylate cyclase (GGDEF)-like protein
MLRRAKKLLTARLGRHRSEHGEEAESPLTGRIAVYAAVAMLVAAFGIFYYVRAAELQHAEQEAMQQTELIATSILDTHLHPSDMRGHLSPQRIATLNRLMRREVLAAGGLRVKLYSPDGHVVYSDDRPLIGTVAPDHDNVESAAAGHAVSDVSRLNAEGGGGSDRQVLETYVPAAYGGAFELYQDYAPIAAQARNAFVPLAAVVAGVFFALYLFAFPILRRASTRMRRQMERIQHQSFHDALTGLPNRRLFNDRVAQALLSAQRRGERVAVMLLDLDRFKEVNDTLGHRSGDELLQLVGQRLGSALRQSDTVARLGGDEFAILAPNVSGPEAAVALAGKVRAALMVPHAVGGLELEVDASIGITIFPDHGSDVDVLTQRADVAMYVAKRTHKPIVYTTDQDHYSPLRLALMGRLRRAISNGEMIVYYQPQADVRSGEITSVEALVRWQHPEHGLLGPDAFVPLAEHIGLIRPLTVFVLGEALRQCQAWRRAGIDLGVSVNITGRDLLDHRLPLEVRNMLKRFEIEPEKLELEITEDTVLSDPLRAHEILTRLNELGVRLAIDDYGTGNSSLAYLKRLPVSVLKIDKSFVLNMSKNHDDAVIVRSTIDLGHNLGLRVIAEGVEDEQAWRTLADLECDVIQGYYLAKPSPPGVIAELTARRRMQAAS